MKISRRQFLFAGAASGLAALVGYSAWRWGKPRNIVVAILQNSVGHLQVDPDTFWTFANDYLKYKASYEQTLSRAAPFLLPLWLFNPYKWLQQGNALRRLTDNVVSTYLLSTDFFQNGADERRPVNYISFYDVYVTPCRNPFANKP